MRNMVKAFMISFQFQGRNYLAMISDLKGKREAAYAIKLYHENLRKIIPEGEINYSEKDMGMLTKYKNPKAKQLLHCIHDSVSEHLRLMKQFS
jgi:hypothetical protein